MRRIKHHHTPGQARAKARDGDGWSDPYTPVGIAHFAPGQIEQRVRAGMESKTRLPNRTAKRNHK